MPTGEGRAEHRVRGSRFLAVVRPCPTLESALAIREAERRLHHDATHHVFAVRLADGRTRSDDDGEPSGTGGRPVLAALAGAGLVDATAVVTRWFGGVKLGTGGLARAYGEAATAAIRSVAARRVIEAFSVTLSFGYEDTGAVARVLEAARLEADARRFGERTEMDVAVPCDAWPDVERKVMDATAGRIRIRRGEARVLVRARS
ncbi:MAG: IMPACT family protein [Gemmatimonadota bacterium]